MMNRIASLTAERDLLQREKAGLQEEVDGWRKIWADWDRTGSDPDDELLRDIGLLFFDAMTVKSVPSDYARAAIARARRDLLPNDHLRADRDRLQREAEDLLSIINELVAVAGDRARPAVVQRALAALSARPDAGSENT
jgi:hypothetical protein